VREWITPEDLRGALLIGSTFVALIVAAELWRHFGSPKPEHTRKLIHLGGGIACLFFPFLIRSPWVVLAMALPLTALFVAGAQLGFLQSLHGIGRKSRGAEYYPLAVWLVLWMTQGRPWLYLAAVLVLAVGDAFAALVGSRYGVVRYEVEDETKSLEGSLVFFVIAFLAIHLPTLLLTDLPRPVCVLAATLVACLVTGFEAISLRGADNLFVPLAVVVILGKITTKPLEEVVFQNLSLLTICLGVGLLVWRYRAFNVGGAITFILFAYGTWSLGSWLWATPVLVGFLAYLGAWLLFAKHFAPKGHGTGFKVRTLSRACIPPFVMLLLGNSLHHLPYWFGPYVGASAAVLCFSIASGVFRLERRRAWHVAALGVALLATALVAGLPAFLLLVVRGTHTPLLALAAPAATTIVAALVNTWLERRHAELARSRDWTGWRFLLSLLAAGTILILQAAGWVPPWGLDGE
jgi:phytol kinase